MAFSRYTRAPLLNLGEQYGTSTYITAIHDAVKNGTIKTKQIIVRGSERLDTIAGENFGDSRYWWVIAAASGIGWGLQLQPGTVLQIPDINDIAQVVS